MARKPNYSFERNSRAKAKADKREAKRQAKLGLKAENEPEGSDPAAGDDADAGEPKAQDSPEDVINQ